MGIAGRGGGVGAWPRQNAFHDRIANSRRYFEAIEASAAGRCDSPLATKRISTRRRGGPKRYALSRRPSRKGLD